jgi:hypothetical protein
MADTRQRWFEASKPLQAFMFSAAVKLIWMSPGLISQRQRVRTSRPPPFTTLWAWPSGIGAGLQTLSGRFDSAGPLQNMFSSAIVLCGNSSAGRAPLCHGGYASSNLVSRSSFSWLCSSGVEYWPVTPDATGSKPVTAARFVVVPRGNSSGVERRRDTADVIGSKPISRTRWFVVHAGRVRYGWRYESIRAVFWSPVTAHAVRVCIPAPVFKQHDASVAQWIRALRYERRRCPFESGRTLQLYRSAAVAQTKRAPPSEGGGPGFESRPPLQVLRVESVLWVGTQVDKGG